jgi:hypothetical protein
VSPTVFKPRGFTGGYDQRFVKPFQPGASGPPPVDPLAGVYELHATDITIKPSGHMANGTITQHGVIDGAWLVQHAYGQDLEVYQVG